jgi:hypothetical protein
MTSSTSGPKLIWVNGNGWGCSLCNWIFTPSKRLASSASYKLVERYVSDRDQQFLAHSAKHNIRPIKRSYQEVQLKNYKVISQALHFHINWPVAAKLDWEPFESFEKALERAKQLSLPGEHFIIEKYEKQCPACAGMKKIAAHV